MLVDRTIANGNGSRDAALSDLSPGDQVLATVDHGRQALSVLPDRAFDNLLVISTGAGPDKIERQVRERGTDPSRVGVIPVVGSTVSYDGPLWVADRTSPSDFTGLSIRFSKAARHLTSGRGWVCVDSLSTLYMYADEQRVYRLVQSLTSALREQDLAGVFRVGPGTVTGQTREQLRGLFDEHRTRMETG